MQLSRRDAIVALGALGGTATVAGTLRNRDEAPGADEAVTSRLLATARAIYPPAVAVDRSFITTYVRGRLEDRPNYAEGQTAALQDLRDASRRSAGRPFTELDIDGRRSVLRRMGVPRAQPHQDGTVEERIRYYVVNDLIYVLFSTPVGGQLVGCENPPGYPGGLEAYQRGPEE